MKDWEGLLIILLYPLWMPILLVLGCALFFAAAAFFLVPVWWTQCQAFALIAGEPLTWSCFK